MHTYEGEEKDGVRTLIHHNSDLSGNVTINRVAKGGEAGEYNLIGELEVPGEDLIKLVAQWVASERIARLEQARPEEIFNLPDKV